MITCQTYKYPSNNWFRMCYIQDATYKELVELSGVYQPWVIIKKEQELGIEFRRTYGEENLLSSFEYFIKLVDEGWSRADVHRDLGIPRSTIIFWEKRHDLKLKSGRDYARSDISSYEWFKDKVDNGVTVMGLIENYGCSRTNIRIWENKHGLKLNRETKTSKELKYLHTHSREGYDWFDTIDTEEKAYTLGLLASDGNVNDALTAVKINLHKKDVDILQKVQEAVGVGSLSPVPSKEQMVLLWSSKYMAISLEKYHIIPRKSFTVKLPDIDIQLMRHYVRGLFDGDGHIGKRQGCYVSASLELMVGLKALFERVLNVETKITVRSKRENLLYVLDINRKHKPVFDWIYGNEPRIFMDRKMSMYKIYWENHILGKHVAKRRSRN